MQDIKVNRISDMQSQTSKKIDIERKKKPSYVRINLSKQTHELWQSKCKKHNLTDDKMAAMLLDM